MSLLDPHTRWSASFLSMARDASAEMDLNIKSILQYPVNIIDTWTYPLARNLSIAQWSEEEEIQHWCYIGG